MDDLDRIKKLSGIVEALGGYEVPGNEFNSRREEEFLIYVEDVLSDIGELKQKIGSRPWAPSTERKFSEIFKELEGYFDDVASVARKKLQPAHFPKRRR